MPPFKSWNDATDLKYFLFQGTIYFKKYSKYRPSMLFGEQRITMDGRNMSDVLSRDGLLKSIIENDVQKVKSKWEDRGVNIHHRFLRIWYWKYIENWKIRVLTERHIESNQSRNWKKKNIFDWNVEYRYTIYKTWLIL